MTLINDRNFLQDVLRHFQDRQLAVWLFGGWAEELHGLSAPRTHKDVDLLVPAHDFRQVDAFFQRDTDWQEIVLKRFPHKRAALFQGIMVEFLLIRQDEQGIFSSLFDRLRFDWPEDTLCHTVSLGGMTVNVASRTALQQYRMHHAAVREAYRDYMAERVYSAQVIRPGRRSGRP